MSINTLATIFVLFFILTILFTVIKKTVFKNPLDKVIDNKTIFSCGKFPKTIKLEKKWKIIQKEYIKLPKYKLITDKGRKKNIWVGDREFDQLKQLYINNYGWINGWKSETDSINPYWLTWALIYNGQPVGKNAMMCPKTVKLLMKIPGINVAAFSVMKGSSKINAHQDSIGIKYGSITYHLGIDVPTDGECNLQVLNKKIKQKNGQAFLFDSTFTHSALNSSNNDRCILYIDFQYHKIM